MKTKSEIRNWAKRERDNFSPEYIREKSAQLVDNLIKTFPEIAICNVMSYKSIRGEVDLSALLAVATRKIYYPQIVNGEVVAKSEDFVIGKFGVCEPTSGEIDKRELDICLVPGVAFSKNMGRIGFGKGYYDRFLEGFQGLKIGITYETLLQEEIETEQFDIGMDVVITENKVYRGQA